MWTRNQNKHEWNSSEILGAEFEIKSIENFQVNWFGIFLIKNEFFVQYKFPLPHTYSSKV